MDQIIFVEVVFHAGILGKGILCMSGVIAVTQPAGSFSGGTVHIYTQGIAQIGLHCCTVDLPDDLVITVQHGHVFDGISALDDLCCLQLNTAFQYKDRPVLETADHKVGEVCLTGGFHGKSIYDFPVFIIKLIVHQLFVKDK